MSSSLARPEYGNWVSTKFIYGPAIVSIALIALSLFLPVFGVLAVIPLLCFLYFVYARYQFASGGGNIQDKVEHLALDSLVWDGQGRAVDIGCGNGPLTIMMAKKYPAAHITGVDYWGKSWEYSKGVCESNAQIESVGGQVSFERASAAALPFEDGLFDAAVSNLTFHEVSDAKDKRLLIKEALRVVKKGGSFAFQDLFLWTSIYGDSEDLLRTIRSWGVESIELINTSSSPFIPGGLRLPFMVGTIAILRGTK
jgi:SAM-dependent methyltransferase